MLRFRTRRRTLGFTLIEVMAVSGIMATLHGQGGFRYAITRANQVRGINNLKQIHMLLQAQCIGGQLPSAAFYPKGDPKKDPKSIVRLIQGAPQEIFISPFAPEGLRKKGLTFAWNDTVNGKQLDLLPRDTWLLIDLAAFIADPKVPRPSTYLVLYANGRAEAVRTVPRDIEQAVNKARTSGESKRPPTRKAEWRKSWQVFVRELSKVLAASKTPSERQLISSTRDTIVLTDEATGQRTYAVDLAARAGTRQGEINKAFSKKAITWIATVKKAIADKDRVEYILAMGETPEQKALEKRISGDIEVTAVVLGATGRVRINKGQKVRVRVALQAPKRNDLSGIVYYYGIGENAGKRAKISIRLHNAQVRPLK